MVLDSHCSIFDKTAGSRIHLSIDIVQIEDLPHTEDYATTNENEKFKTFNLLAESYLVKTGNTKSKQVYFKQSDAIQNTGNG